MRNGASAMRAAPSEPDSPLHPRTSKKTNAAHLMTRRNTSTPKRRSARTVGYATFAVPAAHQFGLLVACVEADDSTAVTPTISILRTRIGVREEGNSRSRA